MAASTHRPLSFRGSTKTPEAEEDIDLYFHRPLAYLVARAFVHTPVTPNQITFISAVLGVAAGVFLAIAQPWSLATGAALIVASTVLDCADGQLARMKGTSSLWGRLYDAVADNVVGFVTFLGAAICILRMHGFSIPLILYILVALVCGNYHTMLFDYYKQAWLLMVLPDKGEFEDVPTVEAKLARLRREKAHWFQRLAVWLQLSHHLSQASIARRLNPANILHREEFPYSPEGAAEYRARNTRLLRAWSFFGPGWHFFLVALAAALGGQFLWYCFVRVVVLNVVLAIILPLQRRATRETVRRISPARPAGGESAT
ncbi:MAG TPA: CDP-alcohol phosphatidyltransferase family protein [Polyangia bacterium]|jgi:hypothetical protein